jgi:ABC-type branched-subunit amino acid transport system substrate-binding protein
MRIIRTGAAAAVLALALAACGSDRSESPDTTDGGGESPAATDSAEQFGTLASPCGDGDASGSTDQGVTDDAVTIGYGDDRGFTTAPGLNKEIGDAVEAMIEWCNEQGGINGRQIEGILYDAAYSQAAQVMQKACKETFMLVGEGFAYDEAAEPIRVGCNLPVVAAFVVGPNASMGPMKFEPVPYPIDRYNTAPLQAAAELYPEFSEKMDMVGSNSPAVQAGLAKVRAALDELGITPMDCGVELAQEGNASYVPFAERFQDCGAEALWTTDNPDPGYFSFLEAMDRIGYAPQKVFEATWYSQAVAEWNKGAGDGITAGLVFQPLENAGEVPAVQQYQDLVKASGGKVATLGMQGTSAFLLWATAAKECGDDLTRQCMVNELSSITEWTGGGLHTETNPGENLPAACSVSVKLTGNTWEQVLPEEQGEFYCPDDAVVETPQETWAGVKLNEDRISTEFLTDDVITPEG